MEWGSIVVEANTAEESEELRQEIIEKAALLRTFELTEQADPFHLQDPAQEADYFIVVREELRKLDRDADLDEDAIFRLLDVPEASGMTELPEDLVVIDYSGYPKVCAQLQAFMDSVQEPEKEQ